jgi:heme ABC exporter ATP-binding subunit CcmA
VSAAELEAVEKHFGRVRALVGISTSISRGSLVLVSGPNGAGKSTLLRVLSGLMRPTRGSVSILGADLYRPGGSASRGRIGYLGGDAGLYGELTLRENLDFCARLHGIPDPRVDDVVARLGLEGFSGRRLAALSLGYRRRTGLARVLLGEPELLLLDEPWNGLDAEARESLTRILRERQRDGLTTLAATHEVGGQQDLFDAEIRMRDGRLTHEALP